MEHGPLKDLFQIIYSSFENFLIARYVSFTRGCSPMMLAGARRECPAMFNFNRFGDGHSTAEQNHFQVDMGVSTQTRAHQNKKTK